LKLEAAAQRVRKGSGRSISGLQQLRPGTAPEDAEAVLRGALRTAKHYGMEHLPAYRMVQLERKQMYDLAIPEKVRDAIRLSKETHDPKLILAAWKVAQEHDVYDAELEALAEDVLEAEEERRKIRKELALPSFWKTVSARGHDATELGVVTDAALMGRIQALMDATLTGWGPDGKFTATRDRKLLGHKGFDTRTPKRVVVEEVVQVENPENYLNFRFRKSQIQAFFGKSACPWPDAPQVRTKKVQVHPDLPVDDAIHEVYMWHGTNPTASRSIATTDFDLKRVGSARGTLFGRGIYFAESCLKADEYSHPDERGLYPILLARVVLGRLNLCQANRSAIDPNKLENSCTKIPPDFDSVCGDREFSVGTFREFVVFDNNQVYPEFIVWYRKHF